jgi:hypothetical protein
VRKARQTEEPEEASATEARRLSQRLHLILDGLAALVIGALVEKFLKEPKTLFRPPPTVDYRLHSQRAYVAVPDGGAY